jgi:hypothetical protein
VKMTTRMIENRTAAEARNPRSVRRYAASSPVAGSESTRFVM